MSVSVSFAAESIFILQQEMWGFFLQLLRNVGCKPPCLLPVFEMSLRLTQQDHVSSAGDGDSDDTNVGQENEEGIAHVRFQVPKPSKYA